MPNSTKPTFPFTAEVVVRTLPFEEVRAFCQGREVELILVTPSSPFDLCLHAEYDGYGDFFRVDCEEVNYVDLAGGMTVGDVQLLSNVGELVDTFPKWRFVAGKYDGTPLVLLDGDAEGWEVASDDQLFLILAADIIFRPGVHWPTPAPPPSSVSGR